MTVRLELPGRLDTAAVPAFIDSLRAKEGADLILDAGKLEQVGALAVQAIIVAANDWQDGGHSLKFENVNDEVEAQFRLLGTSADVLTEGDIR